ncbi:hypothetical protein FOZ60_007544 [Perkinsus olseni]|uniref:Uncharacterized protein n=1 Tax=Perkinsus olseni TaxID=32597 RepID=A0A7J6PMV8_PEROL|nr:hypothetical protein FOZ60_007544 [Perkinsus olseni]
MTWPADWSSYHRDRLQRYCHNRGRWVNGLCECFDQWKSPSIWHWPDSIWISARYQALLQCTHWDGPLQWNETRKAHVWSGGVSYYCSDIMRWVIPEMSRTTACFPANTTQHEYEWYPYLFENVSCPYTWNRFMQRCECQEGAVYAKRNHIFSTIHLSPDEWHIPCPRRGTPMALPDNGTHWLNRTAPLPEGWPHTVPNCAGRGNWSESQGTCACEEGWISVRQPDGSYQYCAERVSNFSTTESPTASIQGSLAQLASATESSSSNDTPMIVVAIPFLVVIVGQFFAILWLVKALRRQAKESTSTGTAQAVPSGGSSGPTGEIHNASASPRGHPALKSP